MKLENNTDNSNYSIRGYDEEGIRVNDDVVMESFVILPDQLLQNWRPSHFSMLKPDDLELIINLDPEIIILGSGKLLSFPDQSLIAAITAKNIGFEVMDTYAACRCYSILVSEGRYVAAGMILEK